MAIIHGIEFPYADDEYHDPNWVPRVIGKRVKCYDGVEKVTGRAKYPGDVYLTNMLHAKILDAPVAHANIKSIDTSKAEALPGVKAVATYKDGLVPDHETPDRLYLVDKVRQYGDPVAAVAAETIEIAEEALNLIEVEYKELPIVLDAEEALKPEAPQISPELFPGNLNVKFTWGRGDVEEGFMEADHIFEMKYVGDTPSLMPPELLCCVANYENGQLLTWQPGQGGLTDQRAQQAEALGMPMSKIRVTAPYSGSGFGSSTKKGWFAPVASLLSKKTGRPVRLEYDIERQTNHAVRAKETIYYKMGVKNDGTITAAEVTGYFDGGAYSTSNWITAVWLDTMLNTYGRIENFIATGYYVLTNRSNGSEYRGFGGPQTWGLDALMDEIAEELDLDPVEFRERHATRQFDPVTGNFGVPVIECSSGFPEVIEKAIQKVDWDTRWQPYKSKASTAEPKKIGIGLAAGSRSRCYWLWPHDSAVRLLTDGTVIALEGSGNFGVAEHTITGQVVAEILGLPFEKVKVMWGDSDSTPCGMTQACSMYAELGGDAYRVAAEDLRQKLFEIAAPLLEVNPEDLEAKDEKIRVKGSPDKAIALAELSKDREIWGYSQIIPPPALSKLHLSTQTASCIEVEIDAETGNIDILQDVQALDAGRALNPDIVEGQITGGATTGLGEAWMADSVFDPTTGIPLNYGVLGHRYPMPADVASCDPIIVESIDPLTGFGQKGLGEMTTVSPRAALANAIYNAIGVRIRELPITPDRILKALGKV